MSPRSETLDKLRILTVNPGYSALLECLDKRIADHDERVRVMSVKALLHEESRAPALIEVGKHTALLELRGLLEAAKSYK